MFNNIFWDNRAGTWTGGGVTLSGPDGPERLRLAFVSSGFFSLLGIEPALGRSFRPEEDRPGNDQVVVLSHGLWARRFASDRNIIGRTLILNALQHTVVGVMPRHFRHPETSAGQEPELWIPLAREMLLMGVLSPLVSQGQAISRRQGGEMGLRH